MILSSSIHDSTQIRNIDSKCWIEYERGHGEQIGVALLPHFLHLDRCHRGLLLPPRQPAVNDVLSKTNNILQLQQRERSSVSIAGTSKNSSKNSDF